MKLTKMLADIRLRMPNPFSDADIIGWLNSTIRETYKTLAMREGYTFTGVEGRTLYPLPHEVRADLISAVLVDGREYTARRIGDAARNGTWYKAAEGFLGIYPAAKSGAPITIFYFMRPPQLLTEAEAEEVGIIYADQEIALDEDYAELIKCGVFVIMAAAREDVILANNYKLDYNMLLSRARQERFEKDGKYPKTRMVEQKRRHL